MGSVYPNPADEGVKIFFSTNQTATVEAALYNLAGVKIAKVFNGKLAKKEEQVVEINTSDINPGFYMIRFEVNGEVAVAPIAVQH
ncbi:MAG: T9SS type A sorting domain-containing protein [Flavobacteriales bacterium]